MSKVVKHEGLVYLDPIPHVYINRKSGEKYKSVTTAIKLIEHEFNVEEVATAIERQRDTDKQERYIGLTKEQIIEYWDAINYEATEYGTHVHNLVEEYLLKSKWLFPESELDKKVLSEFEDLKLDLGHKHYPERILFSEEYKLAGTTDLLVDVDDIYFDVVDWKTNRVFDYYSPFKTHFKAPFEYLQQCHYNIYSLQLSTYALMCEMETGKKCRQIYIAHWDKIKEIWSTIPVMYMRNEALKLMKLHRMNLMR